MSEGDQNETTSSSASKDAPRVVQGARAQNDNIEAILVVQGKKSTAERTCLVRNSAYFYHLYRSMPSGDNAPANYPHAITFAEPDVFEAVLHYLHTGEIKSFDRALDWCKFWDAALKVM